MGPVLDPSEIGLRFGTGRAEARTNCPFCGDKGGHLYGNARKGVFYCFRCGAKGRLAAGAVALAAGPPRPGRESEAALDPEKLDAAYRALLGELGLSQEHREQLRSPARGLADGQIEEAGYRSLPEGSRAALGEAVAAKADPSGVPGFWRAAGKWRVAGPAGLLLPVRDPWGRVLGLQVRRDRAESGPRYVWLSSAGRPAGTPARALCHTSLLGAKTRSRVWITEGPLKADIAATRLREPVLAVPGVNTWRSGGLFGALGVLGASEVVIAFDADAEVNPHVDRAACELGKALRERGRLVFRASWPLSQGKGLDDLLLGGRFPEVEEFGRGGICLNRLMLTGEVVGPPALQTVKRKDGSSLLKARLLVHIEDDGRREVVSVNAWEKMANRLKEAGLKKGDWVFFEGKLKVRREESGSALEVWLSDFELLKGAAGNGSAPQGALASQAGSQSAGLPAKSGNGAALETRQPGPAARPAPEKAAPEKAAPAKPVPAKAPPAPPEEVELPW